MPEIKVISIEDIQVKAAGIVIEIPDWIPGKKIAVRVKSIDMTPHIMQLDKLPNTLKTAANEVFNGGKKQTSRELEKVASSLGMDNIEGMMPIIESVVADALVEPKYADIQAVYPMTLVQKMEIFKFAMGGLEKLDSFR